MRRARTLLERAVEPDSGGIYQKEALRLLKVMNSLSANDSSLIVTWKQGSEALRRNEFTKGLKLAK